MKQIISLILVLFTGGCFNLATAPSQISGAYVSDVKYNHYSCDELAAELSSLARRENQLVTAQEQRRSSSQMQAFWLGYGHGDGIEASELANVRGEREAVRRAMEKKQCGSKHSVYRAGGYSGPQPEHVQRDLETIEEWHKRGLLSDQEALQLKMEALKKY